MENGLMVLSAPRTRMMTRLARRERVIVNPIKWPRAATANKFPMRLIDD
jgi:hypothetical protein